MTEDLYYKLGQEYDKVFGGHMKDGITAFGFALDAGSYTEKEQIDIMRQCLRDNKPWYEYPEIYEQVKAWDEEAKQAFESGIDF